jgi:metal-responsive CopG/Arc/MetJ family transcriptional regulator
MLWYPFDMAKKSKIIQVPMPASLVESLDELSEKQDVSRSALIREACTKYVTSTQLAEWDKQSEEGYARIPEDAEGGWRDKLAAQAMGYEDWSHMDDAE